MIRFTGHDLTLSTKLTKKRNHIVVDDRNFELIKSYGCVCDTMNDAITAILSKIPSQTGSRVVEALDQSAKATQSTVSEEGESQAD